jgi:hypothetical protein
MDSELAQHSESEIFYGDRELSNSKLWEGGEGVNFKLSFGKFRKQKTPMILNLGWARNESICDIGA